MARCDDLYPIRNTESSIRIAVNFLFFSAHTRKYALFGALLDFLGRLGGRAPILIKEEIAGASGIGW